MGRAMQCFVSQVKHVYINLAGTYPLEITPAVTFMGSEWPAGINSWARVDQGGIVHSAAKTDVSARNQRASINPEKVLKYRILWRCTIFTQAASMDYREVFTKVTSQPWTATGSSHLNNGHLQNR